MTEQQLALLAGLVGFLALALSALEQWLEGDRRWR